MECFMFFQFYDLLKLKKNYLDREKLCVKVMLLSQKASKPKNAAYYSADRKSSGRTLATNCTETFTGERTKALIDLN